MPRYRLRLHRRPHLLPPTTRRKLRDIPRHACRRRLKGCLVGGTILAGADLTGCPLAALLVNSLAVLNVHGPSIDDDGSRPRSVYFVGEGVGWLQVIHHLLLLVVAILRRH